MQAVTKETLTRIIVKTLGGKCDSFQVKTSETIYNLKAMSASRAGIPLDGQRLIWPKKPEGTKLLEDERTLSYYNIQEETTFYLVTRRNTQEENPI